MQFQKMYLIYLIVKNIFKCFNFKRQVHITSMYMFTLKNGATIVQLKLILLNGMKIWSKLL